MKLPEDLKKLNEKELQEMACTLREEIIKTVSRNGGHLSSNLGVVELTIALHRSFDFSRDRIIWDVGHQCYAHKLLTGRKDKFDTLRQPGGLSGFPRREESVFDAFNTGHASTSISAAVGYARARDAAGGSEHIVAVVGDGALTGGMCYEALSDAGSSKLRIIVVLNDNGMSISKNVGAVSGYLTRMRAGKRWLTTKRRISGVLKKIPVIGPDAYGFFHRIKDSVRTFFIQDRLFESLGFHYLGPVDGNDVLGLERLFKKAKQQDEPVLIHVVTQKGSGYQQAEEHPSRLHGTPPFDVDTGKPVGQISASMGEVAGEELLKMAQTDRRIVAVTAAMTAGTGLGNFAECLPDRFFDVGIAEEHAVTMAAGMSAGGMVPFVAIYDTFLQRAYDQIMHDVCLQRLHVCFLIDRAGCSEDGPTHHGFLGAGILSQMPGMKVLCPGSGAELRAMMHYALQADGPVAIRYGKNDFGNMLKNGKRSMFVPGWEKLYDGNDAVFLSFGSILNETMKAADILSEKGVHCAVYNANMIAPLDTEILGKINIPVITVEEGFLRGGLGSAVSQYLSKRNAAVPVLSLGINQYVETQGKREEQLKVLGLDGVSIASSVIEWRKSL